MRVARMGDGSRRIGISERARRRESTGDLSVIRSRRGRIARKIGIFERQRSRADRDIASRFTDKACAKLNAGRWRDAELFVTERSTTGYQYNWCGCMLRYKS